MLNPKDGIALLDLPRRSLPAPAAIASERDGRRRALYGEAAWLAALADRGKLDTEVMAAQRNRQLAHRIGRTLHIDPSLLYWDIEGFDRRPERPQTLKPGAAVARVREALAAMRKSAIDAERLARIRSGNVVSLVAGEDYLSDLIAAGNSPEVAAALDEVLGADLGAAAGRKLMPLQLPWGGTAPSDALGSPRTRAEAIVAAGWEARWDAVIGRAEQGDARITGRDSPLSEPKLLPSYLLGQMRRRRQWIDLGNGARVFDVRVVWVGGWRAGAESTGELRPAPATMAREEVSALYTERKGRPPNIVEAEPEIRTRLNARGYQVGKETLRGILQEPEFANQRRAPGSPRQR